MDVSDGKCGREETLNIQVTIKMLKMVYALIGEWAEWQQR